MPGMIRSLGVKVPYGALLDVTMSQRQPHEARKTPWGVTRQVVEERTAARSCGVEAREPVYLDRRVRHRVPQHFGHLGELGDCSVSFVCVR